MGRITYSYDYIQKKEKERKYIVVYYHVSYKKILFKTFCRINSDLGNVEKLAKIKTTLKMFRITSKRPVR